MNKQKYINSDYRVVVGYDTVYNGVKGAYSQVEINFMKDELDLGNDELVLAFGETLKAAIKRTGKNTVEEYNKKTCVKDKCLKLYLTAATDVMETEEMLISACNIIEAIPFNTSKEGKIYELIFRYEDEIRECADAIKNAIYTEKDYNRVYQIIVFSKMKKRNKGKDELR